MANKNKLIHFYYDFFDNKLIDSTIVVVIIGFLICLVGFIASSKSSSHVKGSVLDLSRIESSYKDTVQVWNQKYKVSIEKY